MTATEATAPMDVKIRRPSHKSPRGATPVDACSGTILAVATCVGFDGAAREGGHGILKRSRVTAGVRFDLFKSVLDNCRHEA
jgi:hypothetical protein